MLLSTKFLLNYKIIKLIKNIDFKLTQDQKKAVVEINKDLNSEFKMFRLLQGDVGSGKTIVAFISAANVISCGWQVAMMAPTTILANQHYENIKDLLSPCLLYTSDAADE